MIDFLEVLKQKRNLVWPEIKNYLDRFIDFPEFCQIPLRYKNMVDFHRKIVAEYPERKGKYIRPALVLLTASAMGFPEKKAIKTATAMQVSEDWILNHDDIEDDSLVRRGKPALHRVYGKELAINAGDGLHVIMWRILRDNEKLVGIEKTLKIIDEFLVMLDRTVLGQTVELKWIQENETNLNNEDILFILESKTVYYTIAGPMRLGAILAGANKEEMDKLYQ
nr:polyprenyl synthetase family protein [Candidatus Omnitrophota bacterium]